MIIALVFAHVWGVIQLIFLGSLARTVRVRTALTAFAVGLYACAPLSVLLQVAWTRAAALVIGASVYGMIDRGAYTLDPLIEEVVKVLPLVGLMMIASIRRQWSITDCVLTGAAAGSGFGLAESLYRYGAAPHLAHPIPRGWMLAANIELPVVPSVWSTLHLWLPQGAISNQLSLNVHLVWSAIGGLAVGLIVLRRGWIWRSIGAALFAYIVVDHATLNAGLKGAGWTGGATIHTLRNQLWLAPILALGLAWWLDRQRQRTAVGEAVNLAAEQSASPRLLGTLRAAGARLPWSLPWVFGLVRMRRAYNSALTSGSVDTSGTLRAAVVHARDRIDQNLVHMKSPSASPSAPTPRMWLRATWWPSTILWLVLITPSLLYFVGGGWPQTAFIQEAMSRPGVWKLVLTLSVITQAWMIWRLVAFVRSWPAIPRLPIGDDAAISCLRIACGVGAVGLGGLTLTRVFSGLSPRFSLLHRLHAQEAFDAAPASTALQLANASVWAMARNPLTGPYSPQLPRGFSSEGGVASNQRGKNMMPKPRPPAAPALPPNPYPKGTGAPPELPPNPYDAEVARDASEKQRADEARSDRANAEADELAARRAYEDAQSKVTAAMSRLDPWLTTEPPDLLADVAAAKADYDLAVLKRTYYEQRAAFFENLPAARAADAAAIAANPDAKPHAEADLRAAANALPDATAAAKKKLDAAKEAAAEQQQRYRKKP